MAERSPIGRLSRGIGFCQDWHQGHTDLWWRLNNSGGGLQYRLLEDNVRERQLAEAECRTIAAAHERNATLKARQAARALASARSQQDALDALVERDRARGLLYEASVHKGTAAKIRDDINTSHWQDSRARAWVPPPRPRGRRRAGTY